MDTHWGGVGLGDVIAAADQLIPHGSYCASDKCQVDFEIEVLERDHPDSGNSAATRTRISLAQ
jgi:hypothetical protein